ncbi:hypothetical protein DOY81_004276, partial [Sarcophaga bullata]
RIVYNFNKQMTGTTHFKQLKQYHNQQNFFILQKHNVPGYL